VVGSPLEDLAQSVAHPVRWYDGTRLLGELGSNLGVPFCFVDDGVQFHVMETPGGRDVTMLQPDYASPKLGR